MGEPVPVSKITGICNQTKEMNRLKRVLAIVGDYYHDAALAERSLRKVMEPYTGDGRLEVVFAGREMLPGLLAEQPDLVVLFAENRTDPATDEGKVWMTRDVEENIEQYVAGGGAWLAWHSGMASYPEDGPFVRMLKGRFLYHPAEHAVVTYTPVAGTALGDFGGPFGFMDEHYFVECREEETTVFLRSSSVHGENIAGWFHPYGEGRVVCFAPAHLPDGLLHDDFARAMRRLVAWCLQLEP
jgi:hypothetical protein